MNLKLLPDKITSGDPFRDLYNKSKLVIRKNKTPLDYDYEKNG